jgi:hypothetical protein
MERCNGIITKMERFVIIVIINYIVKNGVNQLYGSKINELD